MQPCGRGAPLCWRGRKCPALREIRSWGYLLNSGSALACCMQKDGVRRLPLGASAAPAQDGWTPLIACCHRGNVDAAVVLLNLANLEVNAKDKARRPAGSRLAAECAVGRECTRPTQHLPRRSPPCARAACHPNLPPTLPGDGPTALPPAQEGWTALHHASMEGREEVVRVLLEHKADSSILANVRPAFLLSGLVGFAPTLATYSAAPICPIQPPAAYLSSSPCPSPISRSFLSFPVRAPPFGTLCPVAPPPPAHGANAAGGVRAAAPGFVLQPHWRRARPPRGRGRR